MYIFIQRNLYKNSSLPSGFNFPDSNSKLVQGRKYGKPRQCHAWQKTLQLIY